MASTASTISVAELDEAVARKIEDLGFSVRHFFTTKNSNSLRGC